MSAPDADAAELLSLCHDVLDRARAKGADEVECFAEQERSTSVSLEQNDLKGASVEEHRALGVRVLVGDRLGFAYVNRLDDDGVNEALDDAIAFARAAPPDPANGFVEPADCPAVDALWDDAIAQLPADEMVARGQELLDAARGVDERVSIDSGSFTADSGIAAVASTRGVSIADAGTAIVYGLFGMAIDGDEVGGMDWQYDGERALDRVDVGALGRRFGERVVRLLSPVDGPSYKGRVLFSAEAFEEIFADTLLAAIDGDEVHKGRSRLKDKLGERVAPAAFTLLDDGTITGGLASSRFDREGLPHRRTPLVEDGVLKTFLYDGRSARRAGAQPTGHAAGSARGVPAIGVTNVTVSPGDLDEAALLAEAGDALFVGRFSGSTDAVSGDFSGVAKGSFHITGGERGPAVKETLIAGNAIELLDRVVALGSELHTSFAFRSPWVLVDGVDVTAG
jgi:PmbA protein